MKTFHIYTDASSKDTSMFLQGVKRITKVGVIADWISRNGTNTWRNYYYRHLLK